MGFTSWNQSSPTASEIRISIGIPWWIERYGAPTGLFRGGRVQFTDRKEVIFKQAVAV
jgi:hypothetical protein